MTVRIPEQFDSKFRFILVAAARAKQIQHGAPSRIEVNSRKAAFIAVKEVEENLVPYTVLEEGEEAEEE